MGEELWIIEISCLLLEWLLDQRIERLLYIGLQLLSSCPSSSAI
jgi:predicted Na+-dependent transporter